MKTFPLITLILIAFSFFSCDASDDAYTDAYYDETSAYAKPATAQVIQANFKQNQAQVSGPNHQQENIKYFPIYNPQFGMVSRYVPLPAHWSVEDYWTTPTGSKAGFIKGGPVNFTSIDQVINQVFMPNYQHKIQIVRMEDLPQIARADLQEQEGYYSYMPAQNHTQAKGIEYVDKGTGNKGYFILHFVVKTSQMGRYAYHWGHNLYATGNTFAQDKKAFVYALANAKINPEYLAAYNRKEAGQLAANDAAFQRKMAARRQSFNSAMAASRTNSEISDIYQETWKNTSRMNDRGHNSEINAIHERNTMINPYTGTTTNIESGYKYYYVNQFGQYFGTNDEFYNPERDPNVNHQEWKKMQYQGNN